MKCNLPGEYNRRNASYLCSSGSVIRLGFHLVSIVKYRLSLKLIVLRTVSSQAVHQTDIVRYAIV